MDDQWVLRQQAWIGDAVLALFARSWLLDRLPSPAHDLARVQLFELFTSNQFLASFGEPTRVEARIGRIYAEAGLPGAAEHIEKTMLEKFRRSAQNQGFRL